MNNRNLTSHALRVDNSSHCTTPSASDRFDPQLVSVKVGCLNINPTSVRGRRMYMIQMFVLAFIPHAALILQNCTIMAQLSTTLESSLYLHDEVNSGLLAGDTLSSIQAERLLMTKYVTETTSWEKVDKTELQRAFSMTDDNLTHVPPPLISEEQKIALYHFREDILNIQNLDRSDSLKRIMIYEEINSILLHFVAKQWKSTATSLWRQIAASYELLKSVEEFSSALASSALFVMPSDEGLKVYQRHQLAGLEHLQSTMQYLQAEELAEETSLLEEVMKFYGDAKYLKINETTTKYYLLNSEACLLKLEQVKSTLWTNVKWGVSREVYLSRRTLVVGLVILAVVLCASPVLILLLRHTVSTIQTFTKSIELSTEKLEAEKQKSDLLLSRMLPLPVLRRLRAQRTVPAEAFDAVTIFFSDIVGFTSISANSTPMEVINMLNMLYKLFDEKITKYNVYKVETIGDAYMVVSGLPKRNGNRHASEIADMSLSLMRSLDDARVPHRPSELLRIRAGVNTGGCVAGVVGTTMPRYCLFGDTINTASRMESTGEAMKIHISASTKKALDRIGGYLMEPRGIVEVPGKESMETYWLVGKLVDNLDLDSPRSLRLNDYDQNLLELLIRS